MASTDKVSLLWIGHRLVRIFDIRVEPHSPRKPECREVLVCSLTYWDVRPKNVKRKSAATSNGCIGFGISIGVRLAYGTPLMQSQVLIDWGYPMQPVDLFKNRAADRRRAIDYIRVEPFSTPHASCCIDGLTASRKSGKPDIWLKS